MLLLCITYNKLVHRGTGIVGFKLKRIINFIGEKDWAPTFTSKVLGIIWDCEKDLLVVPGPTRGNLEENFYKTWGSPSYWICVWSAWVLFTDCFKGKTIHEDAMEGS